MSDFSGPRWLHPLGLSGDAQHLAPGWGRRISARLPKRHRQGETVFTMRIWHVLDLPPIPEQEIVSANLDRTDEQHRAVDWLAVARLSVEAVQERAEWTLPRWSAYGRRHLLQEESQFGFEQLLVEPICLGSAGWVNGRHRALFMIRAGATAFAAEDIDSSRRETR